MGNSSIISVVGFLMLFGILSMSFNRRNIESVENVAGYARYSLARDIANSAIHITLRKIDTTATLPSSFTVAGNLHGGTYSVDATTSGDTLHMEAVGVVMDSAYTIKATMIRYPKPFPGSAFDSPLGLMPRPVDFLMQGSALVDGRDHDSTGALLAEPREDKPALIVKHADDSVTVYNNAQDPTAMLLGSEQISINSAMTIPPDFISEIKNNADYSYQTPVNSDLTIGASSWGSSSNPVIVYVDARDTNKVKFAGNSTGWGILLVQGSIEVTGTLKWRGLVVASSTTVIDFKTSGGNSTIIGSFIFDGDANSKFTMKGTGQILYSKVALQKAKNVDKLLAYSITEWYE